MPPLHLLAQADDAARRAADADLDAVVRRTKAMLRRGAILVALLVAVSLPAVRGFFGLSALQIGLETEANNAATALSRIASVDPDIWKYQHSKLVALMQKAQQSSLVSAARLVDGRRELLAEMGTWAPLYALEYHVPVYDSGVPIATLEVQVSMADLLLSVAWIAVLGVVLAVATWWLVVHKAIASLSATVDRLQDARYEAERAGLARATFLATMSHEIRTPMNGVIGMTSLLQDTSLSKTQRHYVDVIRASGDSLLTVINDILEFSKVESGRVMLEPHPFQPDALAEDVLALLGPAAGHKHLDLPCRVMPAVPPWLQADATRLRQVLLNVVGNAVKFTDAGEVLLTVDWPAPGRLRYTVRDTGIGMTQDQVRAIFNPFVQADASTSRRFGGTGLGLAISRRLVEAMGGSIEVQSTPGRGSTFTIEIDAHVVPAPARTAPGVDIDSLLGRRVLLVDDSPSNLEIIETLARGWGMEPAAVRWPHEALELLEQGAPYDLAVLDFNMPAMNGIELAESIRRLRPQLPLVLLSSSEGAPGSTGLFAASLRKPVRRMLLLDTLLSVLSAGPAAPVSPGWNDSAATPPGGSELHRNPMEDLQVLVVEDNPVNAVVVRTMLERLGCRSQLASSGDEALVAVEQQAYDLIFMDMLMPGMDGMETTRRIRRMALPVQPPIVALTANVMAEDRAACAAAGMDGFLSKPVKLAEVERCLAEYARSLET
jgi:signal transduction histidine kinase/DNA-binding response OmpR family regulator